MTTEALIATVRERIERQGPCGLCGARYSFHRAVDAQLGRIIGGDMLQETAYDYGVSVDEMLSGWAALFDLLNEPHAAP